jgi:hypothetical protein
MANTALEVWTKYSLRMSPEWLRWMRSNCFGSRWKQLKKRPASSWPVTSSKPSVNE